MFKTNASNVLFIGWSIGMYGYLYIRYTNVCDYHNKIKSCLTLCAHIDSVRSSKDFMYMHWHQHKDLNFIHYANNYCNSMKPKSFESDNNKCITAHKN
jgi:hypothetical protein